MTINSTEIAVYAVVVVMVIAFSIPFLPKVAVIILLPLFITALIVGVVAGLIGCLKE